MMEQAWRVGAEALGVRLTEDQCLALEKYAVLLARWNARYNLISRKDTDRIWSRHILDSLSVTPVLSDLGRTMDVAALRALDFGTGAGLPGLPLAVALPETDWLLVDRNQRRIRFLELVISELGLANVEARAMDVGATSGVEVTGTVDVMVSRAVDSPGALVRRCGHLLRKGGAMVLLSGAGAVHATDTDEERREHGAPGDAAIDRGFSLEEVRKLRIPGLERAHEVTIIRARTEEQMAGSGM